MVFIFSKRVEQPGVPTRTVTLNIIYLYENKEAEHKSVKVVDEESFSVSNYLSENYTPDGYAIRSFYQTDEDRKMILGLCMSIKKELFILLLIKTEKRAL